MKPLALRNNNPLNIRYSSSNRWRGLTGADKGFCKFENLVYGYRAAFVLLRNYHKKGYDTVAKIVSRWAPASENNTSAYINYVCGRMHIEPNVRLIDSELLRLAYTMSLYEIGASNMSKEEREQLTQSFEVARKLYVL